MYDHHTYLSCCCWAVNVGRKLPTTTTTTCKVLCMQSHFDHRKKQPTNMYTQYVLKSLTGQNNMQYTFYEPPIALRRRWDSSKSVRGLSLYLIMLKLDHTVGMSLFIDPWRTGLTADVTFLSCVLSLNGGGAETITSFHVYM